MIPTQDLHIWKTQPLLPPRVLKERFPMTEASNRTVVRGREAIKKILLGKDLRILLVVGPCSIHDPEGARDYARRLVTIARELQNVFVIVMRVYFSKPRTSVGWKGLINDPYMDGSCDIEAGLRIARRLLLEITEMGLPCATEFLDAVTPRYISDLVSWAAVGARTTESQLHREMASGLSMPVGFKNGTDGSLQIALDALRAALKPHSFIGIDDNGVTSIIRTTGNRWGHIVLRGGRFRTNYDPESIAEAVRRLKEYGLPPAIMVDCSHANSGKEPRQQEIVWRSVIEQRRKGNRSLMGLMLESYLEEGSQPIQADLSELRYGVSVTDPCIGWTTTEQLLREGYEALKEEVCSESVVLST
ncbi:3-deoxy-7-phosphoheptulonate synthase [Candidatus Methylacidithermus pantelleriae]|uniref:Phospho-2-dehydro-3-deoxyheptonate aldolase n=1 Tax=Candidatus Methylacidithermus pantelleriae TaxID=2744239 RepID=A0A8J2BN58_9BACT|nr:3-deoxy-7-phosphoheptulonate synthase [Candidatus Methylacidithermus pantelleriae]CAF0695054.1 3-deoxy-7-phosphoheptulonate synthase, Tyr-sensitive [Candidatus Methylacidithermus pantelleriae]